MEHHEHRGHRISTEARQVGDRWRGYYRIDDGMFQAVVRVSPSERDAHLSAKIQAEAAVHRILDAKKR
jgi:hypothetical protein